MTDSLYIATTQPHCGKSLISLGITELLLRRTNRVGVFRPIISDKSAETRDKNIDLLLQQFNLPVDYDDTYVYTRSDVVDLLGHGKADEVLDNIIRKFKALEEKCDFILCIGSDFEGGGSAVEFDINADVARNLNSPVLIVASAADDVDGSTISAINVTFDSFFEHGCQVLGVIVNRADPDNLDALNAALLAELTDENQLIAVVPADKMLRSPSVREIADHLNATVLFGEDQLDRLAHDYMTVSMQIRNFLPRLTENALLITSGDRDDVLLTASQAHTSRNYRPIAGVVLTGGLRPSEPVMHLLEGLQTIFPVLSVESFTYNTTTAVGSVRSYVTAENKVKIARSLRLFEENVDTDALATRISTIRPTGMTPKMFLFNLVQKAKRDKKHIVLPEGTDERILRAARLLINRDIVDLTLLGDPTAVRQVNARAGIGLDFDRVNIIDPRQSVNFMTYAEKLVELRRHRGANMDMARDWMTDVSYFGTMMVYMGHADGMVSGATHTTQHTIRPALQFVKTKPGFSVVSSVFFMALEDRVLVYGDCAVNPNPTAEQLAEIAIASADTALAFGIEPRVAMLSYSSGASGQGEDVERVRAATKMAQERRPDIILDGPLQYDAAVSSEVAAQKMPDSPVAGQANVFIFPDLNTGNNTYKAVQRETGAIAIGPVLQGLNKPVNDLSRGCTVEDIFNTVTITAIQAQ
jgi:phosphate acetyltransferase